MKIWEPKPPGNLWAIPGLLRDSVTFFSVVHPTSIFSPQVWTILGIFYRQMINVPKVINRAMYCF